MCNTLKLTLVAFSTVTAFTSLQAQEIDIEADRADDRFFDFDQSIDEIPDVDRFLDSHEEGLIAVAAREKRKEFSFSVSLPFTYNSNVENVPTAALSAFHTNPSVSLAWKKSDGIVRPYLLSVADVDLYTRHSDNNASTFVSRVGVEVRPKNLGGVVPYVQYTPVIVFEGAYNNHVVTLHDFEVGVKKTFAFEKTRFSLDIDFVRREATAAAAERSQLSTSLLLVGTITDSISWSIGQRIQGRFYSGGSNDGRDDINLRSTASLAYKVDDNFSLSAGLKFDKNFSNFPTKEFSKIDIGPTVNVRFKF